MKTPAVIAWLPLWAWAQSASDPAAEKFLRVQQALQSGAAAAGEPAAAARPLPLLVLEVAAALLFVLGAVVVTVRLLRKAQRGMLRGAVDGDLIEVLETSHLGPGQRLVAVRLDGRIGVLGVTRENVSLLTLLDRPAADLLRERREKGNPALFTENLNRVLEKFKKPKKVSEFPEA